MFNLSVLLRPKSANTWLGHFFVENPDTGLKKYFCNSVCKFFYGIPKVMALNIWGCPTNKYTISKDSQTTIIPYISPTDKSNHKTFTQWEPRLYYSSENALDLMKSFPWFLFFLFCFPFPDITISKIDPNWFLSCQLSLAWGPEL